MVRIPIRSRFGNAVLGVLGVLYFVAATATLAYYIATNWGANGMVDRLLQFGQLHGRSPVVPGGPNLSAEASSVSGRCPDG